MSKVKGGDLMLFVNGKSIAYATNHTLEINGETQNDGHKDVSSDWDSIDITKLSWAATSENLYTVDGRGRMYGDLESLMIYHTKVDLVLSMKAPTTYTEPPVDGWWTQDQGYTGKAIITDLQLNAPNGEYATFSIQFTGVGPLTKYYNMEMNNDESGNPSEDLTQGGNVYNYESYLYEFYEDGIIRKPHPYIIVTLEDVAGEVDNGLSVGSRITLSSVFFYKSPYDKEEIGYISGYVTNINPSNNHVTISLDNPFVDTIRLRDSFTADGHDMQEYQTDGIMLSLADHPEITANDETKEAFLYPIGMDYILGYIDQVGIGEGNNQFRFKAYFGS